MFDNFQPIPDAESLPRPLNPLVLKLVVCANTPIPRSPTAPRSHGPRKIETPALLSALATPKQRGCGAASDGAPTHAHWQCVSIGHGSSLSEFTCSDGVGPVAQLPCYSSGLETTVGGGEGGVICSDDSERGNSGSCQSQRLRKRCPS